MPLKRAGALCSIALGLTVIPWLPGLGLSPASAAGNQDWTRTGHATPPSFVATPLMDMGTSTYKGFEGGLYPNGSDAVPAQQNTVGLTNAAKVQPLDKNGLPSATGKIVLLSISMSNGSDEWCGTESDCTTPSGESFMAQARSSSQVNHKDLVIVNGAQAGQSAQYWTSPTDADYSMIENQRLAPLGLTQKQVQVVWLKEADKGPTVALPSSAADAFTLETELGAILRAIKVRYPNIQEVFLSSRIYGGYATTPTNPEPYAYEGGFSAKWVIQAQINQMAGGSIDPRAGNLNYGTVAPWVVWGPYLWADGTIPRSDGLTWLPSDFQSDGTHPSASGIQKVGSHLMTFFLTSPYTKCWFSATGC